MMSTDSLVSTIDIAERNPKIGEALNYYQRGNWFNLFKAWETVKEGTEGHSNS